MFYRLEVADGDNFITVAVGSLERNYAVGVIVVVNPVKALPDCIKLLKRLIFKIKLVQIAEETL